MTDHDHEVELPSPWISSLEKLNSEVVGFNSDIADITGIVAQDLEIGRIEVPSTTISDLTSQFSTIAIDACSVLPRLEDFTTITNTPSTLLLNNQKSSFLSYDSVVNSVESILTSTASMAATVRSVNEQLSITEHGQIEGLRIDGLHASLTQETSISADLLSQDSVLMLGERLKSNISTINNLMDTSLATSRLSAEVYAQPIDVATSYLTDVSQSFTTLNSLSAKVYDDLIGLQSIDTSCFLFQAPTVEPYAATRATAVLAGVDDEILDQLAVVGTDNLLDELGDELISRLEVANPELSQVYQ